MIRKPYQTGAGAPPSALRLTAKPARLVKTNHFGSQSALNSRIFQHPASGTLSQWLRTLSLTSPIGGVETT